MTRFRRSSRLASLLAGLATTVLASTAFAQGATITGTVKSAQGQNLQAANIRIADLNVSVGTGEDGVYRITLVPDRVRGQTVNMVVRAIGFKPQTKQITITAGAQDHDFTLEVDGQTNPDAAWYYPEPKDAAQEITGRVAFWKGVEVR